ncbi:epidermal growth factor receptor substrate 15-like 1 isoform X2 [Euwallacea fornicatus]|uniref:epidermal growth factor receptor substrate 15-like 1 isoform X2 n=1 Tax=Euwallacea fornicatus TaxID=995702 RepID=UPI00338DA0EC
MAALPSPTQVAGSHTNIYEAYYSVVDPKGFGSVGGLEAARFLKRSGLSDVVLSRIWDLSDPGGRGSLDKSGMFVALKLVALVQNGKNLSINNINEDVPPPKMGDIPLPKTKPPPVSTTPLITSLPPSAVDWAIKPSEREKYDKLFDSLQPLNGLIPGNKVKNVLMESKLPFDTLGKIWDLADQDKDGMLNRHEFIVAMHLVYKALEKYAIPNTLPPELAPPLKRKDSNSVTAPNLINRPLDGIKTDITAPLAPPTIPPVIKPVQSVQPTIPWVVIPEEKAKSDALFIKSDVDKDGFVSGAEIKDVFLKSGVPQQVLAHIWALCDIKQTGKLNNEQFALAMWFVARCLKGLEPPPALTPEMVPPSFRTNKPVDGLVENNNTRYSNPELDMISKDIEELCKERLALETDIAQKEADIKIKTGEIKNLQSELDTLAATLKQLENQKGEAQKRLNDLKLQKNTVDIEHATIDNQLIWANDKVDKLRAQANEQADLVAAQESELKTKKEQLDGLRQEEQRLEDQKNESLNKLQSMTSNLQETQLNISQVKALTTQLQEQSRQINDAISICEAAIQSGDLSVVPDTTLRISAEFRDAEYSRLGLTNGENKQKDNFGDAFSRQNGSSTGFDDDPFQNDPFKSKGNAPISDSFNAAFSKSVNDEFSADPFGAPFSNNSDPFNNFDNGNQNPKPEKDPFGCDPFAVLHAPTRDSIAASGPPPRPSSPSPALPPKKSKQPPPRPAPPRPAQPPQVKKQQDAFGTDPFDGGFGGSGGFADFSNFESKLSGNNATQSHQAWSKALDFSDDPFKDYRYEDPFNITFDEDAVAADTKSTDMGKSISLDAFGTSDDKFNDKFDPFGLDGRQSVPLSTSFSALSLKPPAPSGRASAPLVSKLPSEDQQLAWAARESLRTEQERKKKVQEMEDADLEMALKLSRIESPKR